MVNIAKKILTYTVIQGKVYAVVGHKCEVELQETQIDIKDVDI